MPNTSPLRRAFPLTLLAACAHGTGPAFTPTAGWIEQPSGTTASLRGVSAVSDRVAWASGARNTVLRTVDGGATWERHPVPGADSLDFRSVRAMSDRVAFVASIGDGAAGLARIYRTTDGGATWTLALADTAKGAFFDALAFWDADHGVVVSDPVGGRMHLLATDDGGRSWRRAADVPPAREGEGAYAAGGAALTAAGSQDAWLVTGGPNGARAYRSTDRARTWTATDVPVSVRSASAGLFAVAFRDGQTGVAAGGDYTKARDGLNLFRSTDGGRTWTAIDSPAAITGFWSGLAYVPGARSTVVAVGGGGTAVSADDGETWRRVDTSELNGVSFAGTRAGWAVGPRGRIVRWGR